MLYLCYKKDGQVAPFLIAVIVVLLMALMVTVNIGKVGITKTNTSNAADAAALAGGTFHTNTLNLIADTNTAMVADYLATVVVFAVPKEIGAEPGMFAAYAAFSAAQIAQFVLSWQNGDTGYDEAREMAKRLAFSNAGIDEPKPHQAGESYEQWVKRDSDFQQWMESEGYGSGYYQWQDKNGAENWFRVDVDAPDFPGLTPMPGTLNSFYFKVIPPCITVDYRCPCCECTACKAAKKAFDKGVSKADRGVSYSWVITPAACPKGKCVPTMAWASVTYLVPIAYINDIVEDNPEITIAATRKEPQADLGLWQMDYGDPSRPGEGEISSRSGGKTEGGSIAGPMPDPEYDSHLIPGGY